MKTKTVDKKKERERERKTKENESAIRGGERKGARRDCHRAATPAGREANRSSCAGGSHLLLLFLVCFAFFLIPPFKEEVDLKKPEIRLEAPGIVLQKRKKLPRREGRPPWPRCVLAYVMNGAQRRPLGVRFVCPCQSVVRLRQCLNACRALFSLLITFYIIFLARLLAIAL